MSSPKIIAFYLPQFHPFKDNDEWWGKGFTEWTNVAKAKPLFKGHYQPKIPTDLGFYDLRVSETRKAQAEMARNAGVYGFCYWHYWFEGHELMERPFWEMVNSGDPDFPFCIGWANETWKSKMWNKDGSLAVGTKTLIEQGYSNEDDYNHFMKLLPVFNDKRYIKVEGKPLVFIHRAMDLPIHVIENWNRLAHENGLSGVHFVGRVTYNEYLDGGLDVILGRGFNAVTIGRLSWTLSKASLWGSLKRRLLGVFRYNGCSRVTSYSDEIKGYTNIAEDVRNDVYPAIYPRWDHSPRSGKNGLIIDGSTPQLFEKHVKSVFASIKEKPEEHQICFLKSWNEWGEGNYMEPDSQYGNKYCETLKKVIDNF